MTDIMRTNGCTTARTSSFHMMRLSMMCKYS